MPFSLSCRGFTFCEDVATNPFSRKVETMVRSRNFEKGKGPTYASEVRAPTHLMPSGRLFGVGERSASWLKYGPCVLQVKCAMNVLKEGMVVDVDTAKALEAKEKAEVAASGGRKADEEENTSAGKLYAQNRACLNREQGTQGLYLNWGFYAAQLRRWTQFVPRQQVRESHAWG